MTQKIVYDFAWVGLLRIYSKYQNLIKKIRIEAVDIKVQNPVVFKSVMYPHLFEDKNESKTYLSAHCNCFIFYFFMPFLLQKQQKTCPKNMQVNDRTGIIFYNSNYTIFYHLS